MIWWMVFAVLGTLSGFALNQLAKNYLANKILRRASPLNLGVAVDGLITVCNSYADLVKEASRLLSIHTSMVNYMVSTHCIYSVGLVRQIITSLSEMYLIPGHSEYQIHGLRYWLKEIYPLVLVTANFSKDSSHIKEMCTDNNKELIATWQKNADKVVGHLETIKEFLENGVGG